MISHFQFLLAFPDHPRGVWHQLQGSGGQLGNGCIASQPDGKRLARVRQRLLILARTELAREGQVRIWHPDRENPAERIEVARPTKILICREVHSGQRPTRNPCQHPRASVTADGSYCPDCGEGWL